MSAPRSNNVLTNPREEEAEENSENIEKRERVAEAETTRYKGVSPSFVLEIVVGFSVQQPVDCPSTAHGGTMQMGFFKLSCRQSQCKRRITFMVLDMDVGSSVQHNLGKVPMVTTGSIVQRGGTLIPYR